MSRNCMRWTPEQESEHRAKRARACAEADGRLESSMDRSIATIERVVASEIARTAERDVLPAVLLALRLHPKVAWAERANTGAARFDGRYVQFGWAGMSDITGQMKDGRRLECECKASDGKPTLEQMAYIELVRLYRGVAFFARSVDDVIRELALV